MSFLKSQRIRLVNIYTFFAVFTSLPYVIFLFSKSTKIGIYVLFLTILLTFSWVWNYRGRPTLARLWLFSFSFFHLFFLSGLLGKEAGFQLIMILVLISGILLAEKPEWLSILYLFTLCITALIVLEVTNYSIFPESINIVNISNVYYGNLLITLAGSLSVAVFHGITYAQKFKQKIHDLEIANEVEQTIHYFSNSLYGKNSIDEILWDVTKNCIGRFGFVDCVIYLIDEKKAVLVQKAAFGNKNPKAFEIYKPIEIPLGQGIVGNVANNAKAEIISDTTLDSRYITDDENRLSEIAVPLIYKGKVLGVIDSEHPEKGFFTRRHLDTLQTIASLCANKIARTLADIEKEKALKAQIEAEKIKAIDELKTKLFTDVSHELRTPLTLIKGTIDKNLSKKIKTDWDVLKIHSDRLLRLINQLLDLSKLESGTYTLSPTPGDIMSFLRMTVSLFDSLASTRNIQFNTNIPEQAEWLEYDHDALEKIFQNLLSNAVKYTRNDSTINIKVEYKDYLILDVSDQGPGIPEEKLQKVFDRFYQLENQENTGTGIGLSITRELIELHGGSIHLKSIPGQGSTFRVILPLRKPLCQESGEKSTKPKSIKHEDTSTSGERERILIVEDHQEISDLIASILKPLYSVQTVQNGEDGIKFATNHLPDLIICDIMMPGTSGFDVCKILKNQTATNHIPIVLLTAKTEMKNKLQGLKTGADEYLVKPFDSEELKTRIKNLLDQRKLLRKKYQKVIELQPAEVVITNDEEIFLKKLMECVEDNMDNSEFEVSDLYHDMGLSRMQLYRKVKSLTNQSVAEFIRNQRLKRAAYLLKEGIMVSQVAYSVGYSSLSNFSKIFKEKYGVPPSEYFGIKP